MAEVSQKVFLIDSSALAYRSYYAFINNPLVNSKNQPTSVLFGYASQVLRLLQIEKPDFIAAVKDLPAPTFRHELYEAYKANRKPTPDDFIDQIPSVDEFLKVSGIPVLEKEGFEADDIMATVAKQAEAKGMQVYMVTRDKDMMQIVNDSIFLFEPGGRSIEPAVRGREEVFRKFGVTPEQIVDFLSLMGDASDNVPGVRKVGPKTAAELLNEYGNLDNIYANIEKISKKGLKKNLEDDKANAYLSKKLVQLDCGVTLKMNIEDLATPKLEIRSIEAFLKKWELHSLQSLLPKESPQQSPETAASKSNYLLIEGNSDLAVLVKELREAPILSVDTETTGLDPLTAKLVGICLSVRENAGWYVALAHQKGKNADTIKILKALNPIFEDKGKNFIFHNAKFDLPILQRHGFFLNTPMEKISDTLLGAHLVYGGERGLSLDELSLKLLKHQMIPIESLIGKKGKNQLSFAEVEMEKAADYGAEDADITLRIWKLLEPKLSEYNLNPLYRKVEMPLVYVLQKMETRGICIDSDSLQELSREMSIDISGLEKEIYHHAGEEFNIGSTQQLSAVLFEKLGLKSNKKTKTGLSTDAAVLVAIRNQHPVIEKIILFRELAKLKNTYVDVLPTMVHERTGRIHTSYSQIIAATGRLSSINPNLQNIPIRTEHGKKIRACFVSRPGDYLLLSADYSQIELRVLAHLSRDPGLLEAYRNQKDIHTQTACALYKVEENEVTADMRRSAKIVNFGVIYGMGSTRLSRELEIPRQEATDFIENYFSRYAGVRDFIKVTVDEARRKGYVETLLGRRRVLPDLSSSNRPIKENAERMAVNTPIQGTAADLIKKAMLDVDAALESSRLNCDMLLQVHDELVFEVSEKDAEQSSALIQKTMESALELTVPLKVEAGFGKNWLEAHG